MTYSARLWSSQVNSIDLRTLRLLPRYPCPTVRPCGGGRLLRTRLVPIGEGLEARRRTVARDGGHPLRPLPGLHGVRERLSVGGQLRPPDRAGTPSGRAPLGAPAGRARAAPPAVRDAPASQASAGPDADAGRRPQRLGAEQRVCRSSLQAIAGQRRTAHAAGCAPGRAPRSSRTPRGRSRDGGSGCCSMRAAASSTHEVHAATVAALRPPKASRSSPQRASAWTAAARARAAARRRSSSPRAQPRASHDASPRSPTASSAGVEHVVVNAAGCGSAMKDYWRAAPAPRRRPRSSSAARHGTSVSYWPRSSPGRQRGPVPLRVAYHDACHLAHAQGRARSSRVSCFARSRHWSWWRSRPSAMSAAARPGSTTSSSRRRRRSWGPARPAT